MAESLTQGIIDSLRYEGRELAPGKWSRDVRWDSVTTGLGVRIYPPDRNGCSRKSFVLSYRSNGRKHMMVIGSCASLSVDDARKTAGEHLAAIAAGLNPLAEKRKDRDRQKARRKGTGQQKPELGGHAASVQAENLRPQGRTRILPNGRIEAGRPANIRGNPGRSPVMPVDPSAKPIRQISTKERFGPVADPADRIPGGRSGHTPGLGLLARRGNTKRRVRRGNKMLLALNLLLAAAIAFQIEFPDRFVRHMSKKAPPMGTAASIVVSADAADRGEAVPAKGENAFSAISERPLFAMTRRPVSPRKASAQGVQVSGRPDFVVTGIITAPTGNVAILERSEGGNEGQAGLVVHPGDSIGDWVVRHIENRRVELENEGRAAVLELVDESVRRTLSSRRRPGAALRGPANARRAAAPGNQRAEAGAAR